ncbi:alkaline phosphatase family protein [Chitinophagaceae bacterium IBVUCB1]|nr:alkaline phosphatase family protein [Chitinophagaceae bacterium IBVUCB1]
MKYIVLSLAFLLCVQGVGAKKRTKPQPKLVVGIVVDQMRWDFLYRYADRYSDGGFKRLMNDGFQCRQAMVNYIPTFTAPGHACAYTGSVPSVHGIAANDWVDTKREKQVYCTEDKTVSPVGGSYKAGMNSPRNLLTTTVGDELKLATNMRAKVFGIAIKDRGAILPAGHTANGAYWFDDSTGNFISSSFYAPQLPAWLSRFNNKRYADSLISTEWKTMYAPETYTQSLADDNKYEGKLKGEKASVFPHNTNTEKVKGYSLLRYLPGGNTIIFKAAKACIRGEALGQDDVTDMLAISLSTPDYIGHLFSPNAIETEDMYRRLDAEIASFLNYLDKQVGKGNYSVFLTADHGAAHNSNYLKDLKIPSGNKAEHEALAELNAYVKKETGKDSMVFDLSNYQVYLNENKIDKDDADREDVKDAVIDWFKKQDGIQYVVDMEDMDDMVLPEPLKTMVINGYHHKRSGCIQVITEPGWYSGYGPTGTTHGTWNPYDTHIPLLFYGAGIRKGESNKTVHMTDIAPTISSLLNIQMPNGCIGEVIEEVLR